MGQDAHRPCTDKGPLLAGGGDHGPCHHPRPRRQHHGSPGQRRLTGPGLSPGPALSKAWVSHIWPADQSSEAGLTTVAMTRAQVPEFQWPVSAGGGRAPQVPPA